MTGNTHQSFCEHADELVSYLYDEIGATEKSLFEAHLADCATCADELADFSVVRSSIVEWRDTAFQPLATPVIQFPSINKLAFVSESSSSKSLLAQIRALFALSPAWTGAAAVAALVICAGLWFVATSIQRTENIAQVEREESVETVSSPVKADIAELETVNSQNESEAVSKESSKPPIIETRETAPKPENKPVKISQPEAIKTNKLEAEKTVKPNKPVLKKSNQSPPPTLLADEDDSEDDSIRLSDLFKEVGS